MKLISILVLLLFFSANGLARTVVTVPEPHREIISIHDAELIVLTDKLNSGKVTDIGWLTFDVTKGIYSHEVINASVKLFMDDYEVTNFHADTFSISNSDGTKDYVSFSVNSNIVTHIEIKFSCAENHVYHLELALGSL